MTPYLTAVLVSFAFWLAIFITHKRLRLEMVVIGLLVVPLAFIDVLTGNYWKPETLGNMPIGIEGFIWTFLVAGIAAVIYDVVRGRGNKRYVKGRVIRFERLLYFFPGLLGVIFLWQIIPFNYPLFCLSIALFVTLPIFIWRADLRTNILLSGICFAIVYAIAFSIWQFLAPGSLDWWEDLTWVLVNIPLAEILFAFCFGMGVGPVYEMLTTKER